MLALLSWVVFLAVFLRLRNLACNSRRTQHMYSMDTRLTKPMKERQEARIYAQVLVAPLFTPYTIKGSEKSENKETDRKLIVKMASRRRAMKEPGRVTIFRDMAHPGFSDIIL